MPRDPRVDAYIEKQAEFARPILAALRERVHAACPECEEAIKWSHPFFLFEGRMLGHMAGFKAHAVFGFWQGKSVTGESTAERDAMGSFGRLTSLADLPEETVFAALVHKAMALGSGEAKAPRPVKHPKPPAEPPPDLLAALDSNPTARATFDLFPPGCRREYVEWVTEAKREETRQKRIAQAVEWLAEGKRRNWKYESC
ncbi:MAG: hypothetical protein E6G94_08190 [Alphaproteobacteria bacterium]|nr:MAG: hypothetical protein E6G94_08190 [Alphaproteobacteria bacterium]